VVRFFCYGEYSFICLGPSSSWLEGKAETPAGKAQATRGLSARPRKAKPCTDITVSQAIYTSYFIQFVRL